MCSAAESAADFRLTTGNFLPAVYCIATLQLVVVLVCGLEPAARRRFPSGETQSELSAYGAAVAVTPMTASLKSGSPGVPGAPPSSMFRIQLG